MAVSSSSAYLVPRQDDPAALEDAAVLRGLWAVNDEVVLPTPVLVSPRARLRMPDRLGSSEYC